MFRESIFAILVGGIVAGCASRPTGPVVHAICIDVPQETPQEVAYVRRKAAEYLKEYGFELVNEGCEVSVKYERFGGFQAEAISGGLFWVSRSGYWSQEGILSVRYQDRLLLEDQQVNLRGYSAKQDLLGDLAWTVVKPVVRQFRPASPPKN
jgi:hypothetical protein